MSVTSFFNLILFIRQEGKKKTTPHKVEIEFQQRLAGS